MHTPPNRTSQQLTSSSSPAPDVDASAAAPSAAAAPPSAPAAAAAPSPPAAAAAGFFLRLIPSSSASTSMSSSICCLAAATCASVLRGARSWPVCWFCGVVVWCCVVLGVECVNSTGWLITHSKISRGHVAVLFETQTAARTSIVAVSSHLVYKLCVSGVLGVQRLFSVCAARLATCCAHKLRHLWG